MYELPKLMKLFSVFIDNFPSNGTFLNREVPNTAKIKKIIRISANTLNMAGIIIKVVSINYDNPLNDFINLNTLVTLRTLKIRAIYGAIVNSLLEES